MYGPWRNGVFAEYALLPLENVFALDEAKLCGEIGYDILDLHLIQTCMIPYAGLADAGVKAGDTVIVAPATGRFSASAVIAALAMGANVIAVGRRQQALDDLIKAFGNPKNLKSAVMIGDVEKDTVTLSHAAGPRGADVFVDFSPPAAGAGGKTPSHILAGISVLRRGGTCCFLGGISENISIPYWTIAFNNIIIRGRFMYEREHAEQVIKLAESGRLLIGKEVGMEVANTYGLEKFEEAVNE